jgi:Fuc2NAc and GlcNAc transferase
VSGWVLSGLLLLAGVWWINLFNFMDGIDGIAGAQAVFILLAAAVLSAWVNADVMSSPV